MYSIFLRCWVLNAFFFFVSMCSFGQFLCKEIKKGHFWNQNWMGSTKMSNILTLGALEAKICTKQKRQQHCGTPCSIKRKSSITNFTKEEYFSLNCLISSWHLKICSLSPYVIINWKCENVKSCYVVYVRQGLEYKGSGVHRHFMQNFPSIS